MSEPLNIVVCIKQVPDTWAEKKLLPADKTLDRASVDAVMNELDEYAIEEALLLEKQGGKVKVLSRWVPRSPSRACERGFNGCRRRRPCRRRRAARNRRTGHVLRVGQGARHLEFDLVILGSESTDARMSVVPAMVAERLAGRS